MTNIICINGQSEGTPGEQGTYLDAQAAWGYLVSSRGIKSGLLHLINRKMKSRN